MDEPLWKIIVSILYKDEPKINLIINSKNRRFYWKKENVEILM